MGKVKELDAELISVCRRSPTLKFIANVRIFFPQPPLRIDSFGTEMGLIEKKRFMEQVGKQLSINNLYLFPLLGVFSMPANIRPSYRNGACIQLQWHLHSTTMEPSFNLKEGDIPIGRSFSILFISPFSSLTPPFPHLFHAIAIVLTFYFLSIFFNGQKVRNIEAQKSGSTEVQNTSHYLNSTYS